MEWLACLGHENHHCELVEFRQRYSSLSRQRQSSDETWPLIGVNLPGLAFEAGRRTEEKSEDNLWGVPRESA